MIVRSLLPWDGQKTFLSSARLAEIPPFTDSVFWHSCAKCYARCFPRGESMGAKEPLLFLSQATCQWCNLWIKHEVTCSLLREFVLYFDSFFLGGSFLWPFNPCNLSPHHPVPPAQYNPPHTCRNCPLTVYLSQQRTGFTESKVCDSYLTSASRYSEHYSNALLTGT